MRYFWASLLVCVSALLAPTAHGVVFVKGASLSGSSFRVLDPQHAGFKASASSDNYQLLSTVGDVAIGSASGSSFGLRSGFLYYPLVIAPGLSSATAGDGDVDLIWSAATMDAGWTLSGYNVCTKPAAGSFTCENVGNVTSFTKSGLSNGTSYTFKIQAKEIFGDVIAASGELSATPAAAGGGGGGGGGGGSGSTTGRGIDIRGYAHPGSRVTILRDGLFIADTTAAANGTFSYINTGLSAGTYVFGFWAQDVDGRRSVVLSIPITITNSLTNVRNVIVAPTISLLGTNEIQAGTPIRIEGRATPNSQVRVRLNPGNREFTTTAAGNGNGRYSFNAPTTGLANGVYEISTRTELFPGIGASNYSQLLPVGIGVPAPVTLPGTCGNPPDINRDTRVNLVDFSILAFWWRRTPLPANRPFDLNCDDQVRLDDFSILAFHWSG